jgi:hypothetical protein
MRNPAARLAASVGAIRRATEASAADPASACPSWKPCCGLHDEQVGKALETGPEQAELPPQGRAHYSPGVEPT